MAKKPLPKAAPQLLWSPTEVASHLKISEKAVSRLCDKRELEYYLVSGKRRFDPVAVREYSARKRKPTLEELT